jgi:16S rRNA (guanine1207-N2)-methyltransferase
MLYGGIEREGYRRLSMAGASGAPHYFESEPAARSRRREVDLVLPDVSLRLTTDRGVFATDAVDAGTKQLLLDGPPLPGRAANLLDLGCGYGPIALTMAKRASHATVWAVDVNRRALALCVENAQANGVTNVRVVEPDGVPDGVTFDAILSNPPIRIGKAALHELLLHWLGRLAPNGFAVLVVQHNLGSDSLARWLGANGWPTRRLSSRAGYRLLEVVRP